MPSESFLPGCEAQDIEDAGARIPLATGGSGPPQARHGRRSCALGFARFAVVRHDRGGHVAHRTARDHPVAVEGIAVLAMAPTASLSVRSDNEPD
jgi:pimeloyl-ACP methyl ester carboxylesterase